MEKFSFTPEPWTVQWHTSDGAPIHLSGDDVPHGVTAIIRAGHINERMRPCIAQHITNPANARAIAALPDLVAALERIAAGQEMNGEFTHAETVLAYQELARRTLAKVKG